MRILFLVITLTWSNLAFAGLTHDSALSWETAESEHFRIHFHDDEKSLANKALTVAESVYLRLTPIFDWEPVEKTEIVLTDKVDYSNGSTSPIPSNRITLFVTPPHELKSLENHAGWFETLILHEFVHALHLDKARRGPKNIRKIFGRILFAFPNVFMPPWMHEGLATYYETDKNIGVGRGQSSYFQMLMRMEVAGEIKPLRQVNQPVVSWPMGTTRYLYGVYFYQFIAETYGEETLPKIVESYSDHWLPYSINTLYEDVLGKDLSELWAEYQIYLEEKFRPQIEKLKKSHLTSKTNLTRTGDFKQSVMQTKDGRILFISDNLESGSFLKVIEQGESKNIIRTNSSSLIDWHEESGVLLAQLETCNNANIYYDLYRVDIDSGEQRRLTQCARYISATWSPDGQKIIAVHLYRGKHALHLLNHKGELEEVLWQGDAWVTLAGVDWSSDGQVVVSAVWREGSAWDIETFDINQKKWSKVTNNMLIKAQPRFVQNTRDIVFSMDEGGVYNIYRYEQGNKRLVRLSSVLDGSFSPFVTQDDTLLSVGYSNIGFDVVQFKKPSDVLVEISGMETTFKHPQFELEPIQISDAKPYSPWESVLPTSWFPSFALSNEGIELGASVFGTDVLDRHQYTLFTGYQSVSSSPVFSLDYTYDRWWPVFKLYAEKLQIPSFDTANQLIALQENQRLDAEIVLPYMMLQQSWSAHAGLSYQNSELAWLSPNYTSTDFRYRDAVAGIALKYDARITYPRGVSNVSTGRLWSVLAESGKGFNGDYTGTVMAISGREYFDLGREQVLGLRLDLGKGDANTRPFRLGGTANGSVIPSLSVAAPSASFNRRSFSLRGYGEFENALTGQEMALVSAEYRFPIARIERGWMAPPLGIHQVFGQVFTDAGRAGNDLNAAKTYIGAGFELGADAILFYNLPIRMQLGYAKGFDKTIGGSQVYFRLGSSF